MKTTLYFFGILAMTTFWSCTKETISGSGEITTELRQVSAFNKVRSEGVFMVTITQGEVQSVEITGDNNILGKVRTQVTGGELRLYLDNDYNYGEMHLQAKITVTRLNGLKNYGTGEIHVFGVAEPGKFDLRNSGSGPVSVEGSASSLEVFNEGSGDINAFGFKVLQCNATMIGSGNLEIECSDTLRVSIEGSGNVYYLGNPVVDATIKGSGRLVNGN